MSAQFSIAYFLDQSSPCVLHHGACTTATTMGAAGDAQWAQTVLTNGDAQPCDCLVGPLVVPSSGRDEFTAAVERELSKRVGFRATVDMFVGDWPESDCREANDVTGAVEWIMDEAGLLS